jgi:hypothetical protein
VNRAYVDAHPNSWYYDTAGKKLYVNTGSDPRTIPAQLTGVVQDNLINSNFKSNLVFKDLVTDESAKYDAGYGVKVESSTNVRLENIGAYRAGKHNIGAINATGFVASGIDVGYAMPDQGWGGATALVAYSDANHPNGTSSWSNVKVHDIAVGYAGWYSHGEGIGQITLKNVTAEGTGVALSDRTLATGIKVSGAGLSVYGNSTVDGLTMTGANTGITLGTGAVIRNMLLKDYTFNRSGYPAPIVVTGANNRIELSTILFSSQETYPWLELLAYSSPTSSLAFLGNVVQGPSQLGLYYPSATAVTTANLTSDYNLWGPEGTGGLTAAKLQAMGFDAHSQTGTPDFVDPLSGDFHLDMGSPGQGDVPGSLFNVPGLTDITGTPRPVTAVDAGAFQAIPEPSVMALLAMPAVVMRRRR